MSFYLVQRMTARDSGRAGFDGLFDLDYMGSSEFEWGAIPNSLKAIRADRNIGIHHEPITYEGTTRDVYFVGGDADIKKALPKFRAWLAGGLRGKEWSRFGENFTGTANEWQVGTNAWWSLHDNVMFALDVDIAARLLKGIKGES